MPLNLCCCFYCFKKKRSHKNKKIKKVKLTVDCSDPQEKVDANFLDIFNNLQNRHKPFNIYNVDGAYTNPGVIGRFWKD